MMAYGSPASRGDVERYYTHIRRGRPPEPAQLEELLSRYDAIGGTSPLTAITYAQATALEHRLRQGSPLSMAMAKVYVGFKHTQPFISETVKQMADEGVEEAVGIVLAPHYSSLSVGVYIHEAAEKASEVGITFQFVNEWYRQPSLNEALKLRLGEVLANAVGWGKVKVVFSAHSLPVRIIERKDPYPRQLEEHSQILATLTGIKDWQFAWQSAGRTQEPWLGPDILSVLADLKTQGYDGVVSCPVGFIADHLEVLYDLDVEAQNRSRQLGLHLARTRSLNDDPLLVEGLYNAIQERIQNG